MRGRIAAAMLVGLLGGCSEAPPKGDALPAVEPVAAADPAAGPERPTLVPWEGVAICGPAVIQNADGTDVLMVNLNVGLPPGRDVKAVRGSAEIRSRDGEVLWSGEVDHVFEVSERTETTVPIQIAYDDSDERLRDLRHSTEAPPPTDGSWSNLPTCRIRVSRVEFADGTVETH